MVFEGVKKGIYYVLFKILKNFIKDLIFLIIDDVKKGEIIYIVNEKINVVVLKIIDKGVFII